MWVILGFILTMVVRAFVYEPTDASQDFSTCKESTQQGASHVSALVTRSPATQPITTEPLTSPQTSLKVCQS